MTFECPAGHDLSRWRNRAGSLLRCDGLCNEPLCEGTWRWSCTLCDFDVCEVCVETLRPSSCRSQTPICPTIAPSKPAPSSKPAPKALRAPAAHGAKGTPLLNSGVACTPSLVTGEGGPGRGLPHESAIYASQSLASVKRDLDEAFPGSGGSSAAARPPPKARLPRAELEPRGELGLRIAGAAAALPKSEHRDGDAAEAVARLPSLCLESDGTCPSLFGSLSPLEPLGLPPAVESRLLSRRAWLQALFDDELGRAHRNARGAPSALELACGAPMAGNTPLPAAAAAMAVASVLLKFEAERGEVVASELLEIGVFQGMLNWAYSVPTALPPQAASLTLVA